MNYKARHAEKTVLGLADMFGAVLVTGARQVGKSTLLEHLAPAARQTTMDDASALLSANTSPETFFDYNPPPVFVDEIQRAPRLFPEMKKRIDRTRTKGMFYLSGSQQFQMMKNVGESLAGRVGIVHLTGLSLRERGNIIDTEPFLPDPAFLSRGVKASSPPPPLTAPDVWKLIHRGDKPELALNPPFDWSRYYGAYVQTYIERDVRELAQVADVLKFQTFMAVMAARTGQMLNLSEVARDTGVSQPTAERWLAVLQASGIVWLLRPWHNNLVKRAIKTPKLYFMDTGLAAYLTRWTSPEVLAAGAMAGAFFETFVVVEVLKSYLNQGELNPPLHYYRDKEHREIDLLIIKDGAAYPVEIKKTGTPRLEDIKAFRVLDGIAGLRRAPGGVVCMGSGSGSASGSGATPLPLAGSDAIIPVTFL
ncbi:MAG: ATP-binding protein [Opitutaceae bacterium]|jgi:predicted AAA+ superfamily ATPase|nr:ATP-binding protein [Opitutaceae bacterium]